MFYIWIYQLRILFHTEILGIRLANDAELKGRLELLVSDQPGGKQWLAVCFEGAFAHLGLDIIWNYQAAWVACRQLGYNGGRATVYDGFSVANGKRVNDINCEDGKFFMVNLMGIRKE